MRTVMETAIFQKQADEIWTIDERHAFIDWIATNPDAGNVIPHAHGARKVRWFRAGQGKRGGVRVIYFHLASAEIVLLAMVYTKASRSTIRPGDIRRSDL